MVTPVAAIANAHLATLTSETLDSLSRLKDFVWRTPTGGHSDLHFGGPDIVHDVSFEVVRRLAQEECLRRQRAGL